MWKSGGGKILIFIPLQKEGFFIVEKVRHSFEKHLFLEKIQICFEFAWGKKLVWRW